MMCKNNIGIIRSMVINANYAFHFILIFVFLFSYDVLRAQQNKDSLSTAPVENVNQQTSPKLTWHKMFTNIPNDYSRFFSESFSKDKTFSIGVLALTSSLFFFDEDLWEKSKNTYVSNHSFKKFSDISVDAGDGKYHLALIGAFAAYGFISGNDQTLKTASNLTESLLASGLFVQFLKHFFGRESPAISEGSSKIWHFFPNLEAYQKHQTKYYSYPSGHITTLVSALTVLANNYPEQKWITPISFAAIAATGIGLMSKDMHWVSDFPLGVFIGYSIGTIVSGNSSENISKLDENHSPQLKIFPYTSQKSSGLTCLLQF